MKDYWKIWLRLPTEPTLTPIGHHNDDGQPVIFAYARTGWAARRIEYALDMIPFLTNIAELPRADESGFDEINAAETLDHYIKMCRIHVAAGPKP